MFFGGDPFEHFANMNGGGGKFYTFYHFSSNYIIDFYIEMKIC